MTKNKLIYILLSSYNGEKYIEEQINSLINQTHKNWKLLIRDDGSSDKTIDIIKKFEKKDKRVSLIKSSGNLGSCKSFLHLVAYTKKHFKPEYIMFCDQDDVWLKDKIKNAISLMQEKEKIEPEVPILVHTNLIVVDKNLNIINKSFWKDQKTKPHKNKLRQLFNGNIAHGCTMLLNKKLIGKIYSRPNDALLHDTWITLIAAAFGEIYRIYKPDILYRQHEDNESGAFNNPSIIYKIFNFNLKKSQEEQTKRYLQVSSFLKTYKNELTKKDKKLCEQYISIQKSNLFKRAWIIISNRFTKRNFLGLLRFIIWG
jgi:glycosyltransferase involved in cell wall biosynthesis